MRIVILIKCLLLLVCCHGFAQQTRWAVDVTTTLTNGSGILFNAWTGGLNSSQVSSISLPGGKKGVFIFDKATQKPSVFVISETSSGKVWTYEPEWETAFPTMTGWVLLRDYDGDGKEDIFTSVPTGVSVYRNVSTASELRFQLASSLLLSKGFSAVINLFVNSLDVPAIQDMDGDGDLDIMCFDFPAGSSVQYHQNISKETYGHLDSLVFKRIDDCWGGFSEIDCSHYLFGQSCKLNTRLSELRIEHVGGGALLPIDTDNDGDFDLVVGKESCDNLNFLKNVGTVQQANFSALDTIYPKSTRTVFKTFPAAFHVDVDLDGKRDLLVTPNKDSNPSLDIDFKSSLWYYNNKGTDQLPDFQFVKKDFLQNTMLDLGEQSVPAVLDYDNDGDYDLVVAEKGFKGVGRLYLLENTGTAEAPAYTLADYDYLNIASKQWVNLRPQFADFNKDGFVDLVLANTYNFNTGETDLKLFWGKSPEGGKVAFSSTFISLDLWVNILDAPVFFDNDNDGDLDALVGKANGSLELWTNVGSLSLPSFTKSENDYLGFTSDAVQNFRRVAVGDVNNDTFMDLISVDNLGKISLYDHFQNWKPGTTINPDVTLVYNGQQRAYVSPNYGNYLSPVLSDLNKDGLPEIILGTNAGGLVLFKGEKARVSNGEDALIWPNPATEYVNVSYKYDADLVIYNLAGQRISQLSLKGAEINTFNVDFLQSGLYLFRINSSAGTIVKKVVIL